MESQAKLLKSTKADKNLCCLAQNSTMAIACGEIIGKLIALFS
jgi:hypothetical protein